MSVTLTEIDALPGEKFEGTISRFSAELAPETRMMRAEMDLDNADVRRLGTLARRIFTEDGQECPSYG